MYVKQCSSAFACALTLSLATGGYAQRASSQRSVSVTKPLSATATIKNDTAACNLISMEDAFKITRTAHPFTVAPVFSRGGVRAVKGGATLHSNGGTVHSFATTNSAVYANFSGNLFSGTHGTAAAPILDTAVMSAARLPVYMTKGVGVTLTGIKVHVINTDPSATSLPHEFHGIVTLYDQFDLNNTTNAGVSPLATYAFDFTGTQALPYNNESTITVGPAATDAPVLLTHDLTSAAPNNLPYGVSLALFDDAAHTIPSQYIAVGFNYGYFSGLAEVGLSFGLFTEDTTNSGLYPAPKAGYGYYFGGAPFNGDLAMEIDGTTPNNVNYNVGGTFIFPGLATGSPAQPLKLSFQSTTNPTAPPIVGNYSLTLSDHKSGTPAVVDGQMGSGTFNLTAAGGLPADTYMLTITSPNFAPIMQTVVLPGTETETFPSPTTANPNATTTATTTGNLHMLNETFTANRANVTGTIALEGVADITLLSFNAPLGAFTVDFYTPGTVAHNNGATPLFTQTVTAALTPIIDPVSGAASSGSYSLTGIPFGTYDVVIKNAKTLAVKVAGVVINTPTGSTISGVILPAGDANNDDSVDSTDFGLLIGAFNTNSNVQGSGYDPTVDFNFDGLVDSTDFGLLIGEFNNVGAK